MGPAMLVVPPKVISAVLLGLPIVRPDKVLLTFKPAIGKVMALENALARGSKVNVPPVLTAEELLKVSWLPVNIILLEEEVTLVPILLPNVAPFKRTELSEADPLILIGPEAASTFPDMLAPLGVPEVVPEFPIRITPPPLPVASIVPTKLIAIEVALLLVAVASPSMKMASAFVLDERIVQPFE